MKRIIDVPNWKIRLYEQGELQKLLEGQEPGLLRLNIDHEPLCAHLRGGVCNCNPDFKMERLDAGE
jgi:hypothetical protein